MPNIRKDVSKNVEPIILPLCKNEGETKVFIEDAIRYYIAKNIKSLEKIFGKEEDIEWYSNNVPYHISGKSIDFLVYHKNMKYTGYPLRYQYSVLELKKDNANEESISQLIKRL